MSFGMCYEHQLYFIQSSLDFVHFLVTHKMCTKPGEFTKLSVIVLKTKRIVCTYHKTLNYNLKTDVTKI